MSEKETPSKSKLLRLKKWLTVPEAARHLSILFGEDVSEADILRLALDRHLKLSVNFVNHADAKRGGKFLPFEEWEENFRKSGVSWERMIPVVGFDKKLGFYLPEQDGAIFPSDAPIIKDSISDLTKPEELKKDYLRWCSSDQQSALLAATFEICVEQSKRKSKKFGGKVPPAIINFSEKVQTLEGVWDLPLIGNESVHVEHEYQKLTGGPEVTLSCLEGAFVEGQDGHLYQLLERFDEDELRQFEQNLIAAGARIKDRHAERKELHYRDSSNYYPAEGLPDDSVLVVRTSALLDLQERFPSEDSENTKPLGPTERRSVLKMILAMAIDGYGYDPDESKSPIPNQIVEAAAKNDHSITDDTVRKWLKEASKLPKDEG